MKIKKSSSNQKSLTSYIALAAAFLSAGTGSEIQAQCTDFDPDIVLNGASFIQIDLNGDGIDDVQLSIMKAAGAGTLTTTGYYYYRRELINKVYSSMGALISQFTTTYITSCETVQQLVYDIYQFKAQAQGLNGAQILMNGTLGAALDNGGNIDGNGAFGGTVLLGSATVSDLQYYTDTSCVYKTYGHTGDNASTRVETNTTNTVLDSTSTATFKSKNIGNFPGMGNKFLGLQFEIDGNTHFGWFELSVNGNSCEMTLGGFGFHPSPNTAIAAGACITLPIEMQQITAKAVDDKYIAVAWTTATEKNIAGYELQRSEDGINFKALDWVDSQGDSEQRQDYYYEDNAAEKGHTYFYRIKSVEHDGEMTLSKVVSASINPAAIQVGDFYPNPSPDGQVQIAIENPSFDQASINVFDAQGKRLKSFVAGLAIGEQVLDFDFDLPKGTYFVQVAMGEAIFYKKLILTN